MANISAYAQKLALDFFTGAATATQPGARWVSLAWGTPQFTGGSEINSSFGFTRATCLFGAAASPAGSASNTASMTFGPFSSIASILGAHLWDGSPLNSSNMLWYGTLATARTVGVGDTLVFAAGALNITLA
jgi:hypothetical protein